MTDCSQLPSVRCIECVITGDIKKLNRIWHQFDMIAQFRLKITHYNQPIYKYYPALNSCVFIYCLLDLALATGGKKYSLVRNVRLSVAIFILNIFRKNFIDIAVIY